MSNNAIVFTVFMIVTTTLVGQTSPLPTSYPYELTIQSDKAEYAPSEQIEITVKLKNISSYTTGFQLGPPGYFYSIDVRVPTPTWIPVRRSAARQIRRHEGFSSFGGGPFFPGDEKVSIIELKKFFIMKAPGKYTVSFSCDQIDRKQQGIIFGKIGEPLPLPDPPSPSRQVHVESNEIIIEILPEKKQ